MASVAGTLVSPVIIALCIYVMVSWSAGPTGDFLLGAAAIGLLLRLPHTIAAWAGLTTFGATAVALALDDLDLANRLADLAYYCISVGCLWALWGTVVARFRWSLPVPLLYRHLISVQGTKLPGVVSATQGKSEV